MSIKKHIPVNEPLLNGKELTYLQECIESGWISSDGPFVKRFEAGFSNFVDRNYGVAVSNGTAALHLSLLSLGLMKGDRLEKIYK